MWCDETECRLGATLTHDSGGRYPFREAPSLKDARFDQGMALPQPQRLGHRRVVLLDGDRASLESVARTLTPVVFGLEVRSSLGELPAPGEYDLLVANYDHLGDAERAELLTRFAEPAGGCRLLLLSAGRCQDDFRTLFASRALTNLLAKNTELDTEDLIVTVQKILRHDVFGMEKYFIWGVESVSTRLRQSADRTGVLAEAEAYARSLGIPARLCVQFSSVADELITNALYNAPRDQGGQSRFSHLPRSNEVVLGPGEEIEVRFCCDGRRLGISASDPFGSLTPEMLLDYLAKCFKGDQNLVDEKPGGAGLGLFYIFDSVSHLVTNISPGKRTEMIGLIDVRGRYRDFAAGNKSFNIFMGD